MPTGTPIAPQTKAAALSLLRQGFKASEVARALGIAESAVGRMRSALAEREKVKKPKLVERQPAPPAKPAPSAKLTPMHDVPAPVVTDPIVASLMARGVKYHAAVDAARVYRERRA